MLLTTARAWPETSRWVLEPKWDGYRILAAVNQGRVRCWTRHGTRLGPCTGVREAELVRRRIRMRSSAVLCVSTGIRAS
jgi:ATP-dependent DNA ligase